MQDRRIRVLVVDDNPDDLQMIWWTLAGKGYDVMCAQSVPIANEIVREELQAGERFDIALVDLKIGPDSGAEFARRLKEIVVDVGVAIITGYYDPAASMLGIFEPDEIVIKTSRSLAESSTLLETVKRLVEPRRVNNDPQDVRLNRWVATSHLYGINDLKLLTRTVSGERPEETEKFISFTGDGYWINTVVYPGIGMDPIALQTTIGCTELCRMCSNWRNQKGSDGGSTPYVRALTTREMAAQVYLGMSSPRIKRLFSDKASTGITINLSGPGDGLKNNLKNCMGLFRQLAKIEKPTINFIITSVGDGDSLKEYLDTYIDVPRVTFYWSVNSLDPRLRASLMPGAMVYQSLERLGGLYEEIAMKTGTPVTASFALFKGVNCTPQEAKRIAEFFRDRPLFKIKLMAGCPGSLRGIPDTTDGDVAEFKQVLLEEGVEEERVRERKVFASGDHCGCGNTTADFLVEGRNHC